MAPLLGVTSVPWYNKLANMLENAKNQLIFIGGIAAFFLVCTFSILLFIDPSKASLLIFLLFYFCLLALSISVFTLIIFFLRKIFVNALHFQMISVAIREAVLLSILLVGSLALSAKGLLFWWIELIFLIALVFIESFFLL